MEKCLLITKTCLWCLRKFNYIFGDDSFCSNTCFIKYKNYSNSVIDVPYMENWDDIKITKKKDKYIDRDKEILNKYKNRKTMQQIADEYDISSQQVLNILRKFPYFDRTEIVKKNYKRGIKRALKKQEHWIRRKKFNKSYPNKICIICKKIINKNKYTINQYKDVLYHRGSCAKIYSNIQKEIRHKNKKEMLVKSLSEWMVSNKKIPYTKQNSDIIENGNLPRVNFFTRYTKGFKKAKNDALILAIK